MANKKLSKMLQSEDKGVSKTHGQNGTLSRLFRSILKKRKVGPERFGALMADYLRNPRYGVADNRKEMTSARGNLGMALAQERMTWKVFCKGLRFLKIVKIDIAIRTYYSNGQQEIHETSMMLEEHQVPDSTSNEDTLDPPHTDGTNADEDASDDHDE
ncbi:MAG: hypothetical protein P4L77_11320 [Sulfuriferula sp.]|nr:hypothetical protein [Sulfuriferula sp.]